MKLTPAEHYDEAERLLVEQRAVPARNDEQNPAAALLLAEALVHATLARCPDPRFGPDYFRFELLADGDPDVQVRPDLIAAVTAQLGEPSQHERFGTRRGVVLASPGELDNAEPFNIYQVAGALDRWTISEKTLPNCTQDGCDFSLSSHTVTLHMATAEHVESWAAHLGTEVGGRYEQTDAGSVLIGRWLTGEATHPDIPGWKLQVRWDAPPRRWRDRDGDIWEEHGDELVAVTCRLAGAVIPRADIEQGCGPLTLVDSSAVTR